MTDFRALCADAVTTLGPAADRADLALLAHRVDEWLARTRATLATVAVGPSDEELNDLICDELGYEHFGLGANSNSELFGTPQELRSLVLTALARYGSAPRRPRPVNERLPEAEDCDAEGRCWLRGKVEGDWRLINPEKSGVPQLKYCFSHWLPVDALPILPDDTDG